MINTERLCFGCMNDNGGERICPICGFDSTLKNPVDVLPIKFIIGERYIVGKVISENSESVKYIGWDAASNAIVDIKEYFPRGLAHRNPDKTVSIVKGEEYNYNESLMEYLEINRAIKDSELPSLINVFDVFEENGTVYAVSGYTQGITLGEFLDKNDGTLKWEQARALFLPLIDTIYGMNEIGIIHRGISVDTIIVCGDGSLRLSDYAVKALRIESSSLKAEIFDGYAAIEQYGFDEMHTAAYTDVYGLSATLFRVLFGALPHTATQRIQNDAMSIPAKFAEELPRHVLAAIANGLQVLPEERTKDVNTLKNELVYGEIKEAAPQNKEKEETSVKKSKKANKNTRQIKSAVISAVCTLVVLLGLAAILVFGVFKDDIFKPKEPSNPKTEQTETDAPAEEETQEKEPEEVVKLYQVPNLKGQYYSDILENQEYGNFKFVIVSKSYSNDYQKGTVCAQSVESGSGGVPAGTEIQLTISLGSENVRIANLVGLNEVSAKLELLKQGFLYENIEVTQKYDVDNSPGVVLSQQPAHGTSVSTEMPVKIVINSYKGEDNAGN